MLMLEPAFSVVRSVPFGIPHGAFVLTESRKSRAKFLAGGKVSATWAWVTAREVKRKRIVVVVVVCSVLLVSLLSIVVTIFSLT